MDTLFDRAAETSRTQLKKMRWTLGLHGLVSVVFGVMILAWPGISVYALTIVFGAYTLATGIVELGPRSPRGAGRSAGGWLSAACSGSPSACWSSPSPASRRSRDCT
jgi:uncharacterized membrane protein HdeD (DUF308 family)